MDEYLYETAILFCDLFNANHQYSKIRTTLMIFSITSPAKILSAFLKKIKKVAIFILSRELQKLHCFFVAALIFNLEN